MAFVISKMIMASQINALEPDIKTKKNITEKMISIDSSLYRNLGLINRAYWFLKI